MKTTDSAKLIHVVRRDCRDGWRLLVIIAAAAWPCSRSVAQAQDLPPLPPVVSPPGSMALLPLDDDAAANLPDIRPTRKPESTLSFVDSLRANDATFEVVVGQGRILSTKLDLAAGRNQALIAVGDPSVIEFALLNTRQIRITGRRIGVTDLSITTANGEILNFEVRVVADLSLLRARLKALYPDASLKLGQVRDSVVVEGEARSSAQITLILQTITTFLQSVEIGQARSVQGQRFQGLPGATGGADVPGAGAMPPLPPTPGQDPNAITQPSSAVSTELAPPVSVTGAVVPLRVINLMKVPGSTQVMLKVRVAELNRTAFRLIGANFLGIDPKNGAIVGSNIGTAATASGTIIPQGTLPSNGASNLTGATINNASAATQLLGSATSATSGLQAAQSTVFGIFQNSGFEFTLEALRRNSLLKILAEPNLVAMTGHQASFLAGGEFPVPVPQVGAGGISPTITVRFREFGVRLAFLPYILDDNVIRLSVAPEVSQIDNTIATTLVAGGTPVPGLNTRKAQTTVELREGQTLAIAGLLQLELDGQTTRIPGLGDLPIIGPFFSNTTGQRIEKELVVLVTPYLIEPMNRDQVPPTPGDEVKEANDLELYLLNRIEGRTGTDFRSTTQWDDPLHLLPLLKLEQKYVTGPSGFSD